MSGPGGMRRRFPWRGPGQLSAPREGSVSVRFLSECEQLGPGSREQGHPLGAPVCLLAARGCMGQRGTLQASRTPGTAPTERGRPEWKPPCSLPWWAGWQPSCCGGFPSPPQAPDPPQWPTPPAGVSPRRLWPGLGVRSLGSLPYPSSSGTSLPKVCGQRLPTRSGEQHLEGRLGLGGGPGPRFLEEQGALLGRVPGSLHNRDPHGVPSTNDLAVSGSSSQARARPLSLSWQRSGRYPPGR